MLALAYSLASTQPFIRRIIVLTCATLGFALATSRLLASRGAPISIADVGQSPSDAAVAGIEKAYTNVKVYAKNIDMKKAKK